MIVVGVSGKAGAGKDTAVGILREACEKAGVRTTQLSFASPLKDICTSLFGWDRKRLDHDSRYKESHLLDDGTVDPACAMLGMTRREVMQRVGTEAMRNGLHQDIWIIAKKLEISRGVYKDIDVGFLSDCRFINELQFVDDQQGLTIRIDRTDTATLTDRVEHASELEWEAWKHWDLEVQNPGNMEEYRYNLNGVLDLIGIELYATGRSQDWPDMRTES